MVNNVILVGRITSLGENIEHLEALGIPNTTELKVAVTRNYKNDQGEYETDFITCRLAGSIATNTLEYCKVGDVVGIKGRLENENDTKQTLIVIVEKITFLSSKKED